MGINAIVFVALLSPFAAHALELSYVPVGNPGNPACPQNNRGAVAYAYEMAATEVTNAQYAEFLNAVAAQEDPYALYDINMATGLFGGIERSQDQGRFQYKPIAGYEQLPVVYVSWHDCARFCNWLHGGNTEDGAYDMTSPQPARGKNARYVLPTVDEWIKAAYYDPQKKDNAGYWQYPVRTDAKPKCVAPPGTSDAANYFDGRWAAPEPFLTPAGAYTSGKSPYGTHDQGGNVMEWLETVAGADRRAIAGGDATKFDYALRIDYADAELPGQQLYIVGFRVVRVGVK
jgi:formylglycine-generating enzyme required for sulfatase activity